MPSLRAQPSTSRPPTSLKSCTLGTFLDQVSEYSRVTWYSMVLLRLVGTQTSPVMGSTSARGMSLSSDSYP